MSDPTFAPPVEPPPQVTPEVTQYTLVEDVSGKPVDPARLFITGPDGKKYKVPRPPKDNCKKCYGRGYTGRDVTTDTLIPCYKCYPEMPK